EEPGGEEEWARFNEGRNAAPEFAFEFPPDFHGQCEGLIAVTCQAELAPYFPGRFYFGAATEKQAREGRALGFKTVAAPAVHYESDTDRAQYDLLKSIRPRTLLRQEHPQKNLKIPRPFLDAKKIVEYFRDDDESMARSIEIAERCNFDFPFGK